MRTSESINEIAAALALAQGEMGAALKDANNPFFKSKYADLASVWDACRSPLTKHGLSVAQFPTTSFGESPEVYTWTSKSGESRMGVKVVCTVSVVTRLLHTSGQWLEDTASAMLATGDPQAVGSAITYLRRYSLQSVAGVAPEDDDGNATVQQPQSARPTTAAAAVPSAVPAGFEKFRDGLRDVSVEGTDALKKTWAAARPEYRQYMTKHHNDLWESLKAKAAQNESVPA